MIVVMQCAASKRPDAGYLATSDGKPVSFVAHPELVLATSSRIYARPDDPSDTEVSWRARIWKYNEIKHSNHLRLCPAYELYENPVYRLIVKQFGMDKVFILSAGWGLIRSYFLTPYYDITFSQSAESYKRRRKLDPFDDFCMLPEKITEDIVFLGGKDYLPMFCRLTREVTSRRIVFFNSVNEPRLEGCVFRRFNTAARTNWHYECAKALLEGRIKI